MGNRTTNVGKILVIANATAGRGRARAIADAVVTVARKEGIRCDLLRTASGDQAREAARAAAASGARVVAAVGGDGTIHHVARGLAGAAGCSLLPVPAGQGNDTVRSLGLSQDWRQAAELLREGRPLALDLLAVRWPDGHADIAVNVLSAGFDAEVAARVRASRHLHGSPGYLLAAALGIWRLRHRRLQITVDGHTTAGPALFAAVANGAYYGGGMLVAPGACMDDGRLDVGIAGPLGRLDALRTLPRLYTGSHVTHPLFSLRRGTTVTIGGEAAPVQIDGEPAPASPLSVTLRPQALEVLHPAVRPSPP